MPFGITFGRGGDHKRTTLQIFTARGDSLVDDKAEKGMDETLSDRYGLSFPARPRQVAVYQLRNNGRKAVRINGIEVEGASPTDVHSDPDYYDKLRSVYSASRSRGKPWTNPANLSFANNQKYALIGSLGFLFVCFIAWMMFKGPSEDETQQTTDQTVPATPAPASNVDGGSPQTSALDFNTPLHAADLFINFEHDMGRMQPWHRS